MASPGASNAHFLLSCLPLSHLLLSYFLSSYASYFLRSYFLLHGRYAASPGAGEAAVFDANAQLLREA